VRQRPGHRSNIRRSSLPAALVAEHPRIEPAGWVVAGRYRLRRLLGRGGMGAVWLATDQALHRPVAVKQPLLSSRATDQERRAARARLRREARLAARVDHTGTVRVYDLAEETGDPWIVMEALPGRTLQAALRDHGPLPVGQVTSLGLGLLAALAATHRAGVVHRDVKPGNVQLCGGQRVVLTDFGIAATIEGGAGASTGGIVGSPGYVAPEQAVGGRVEPASDLFSLGATLYAAVEGRSPFGKGRAAAILDAVVTAPPAPLRRAGPLGPVIEGLLAKDPARRLGPDQARGALQAITGNHISIVNWCKGSVPGGRRLWLAGGRDDGSRYGTRRLPARPRPGASRPASSSRRRAAADATCLPVTPGFESIAITSGSWTPGGSIHGVAR
jgi:eukaryotic-like serine/threonine-protein kinase